MSRASFELVRADDYKCPNLKPTTTELRLRTRYFSYDTLNRAVHRDNNTVDVKFRLVLRKFDFNEEEDKLEIHSWFAMHWKDCRSAWDPSAFDNIREIRLPSFFFWKPDIGDFSTADMAKVFPLLRSVFCILNSDGAIMCMPPYNHVVTCSADLRRWPYDTHTCTMMIGSWTHTDRQMNFSLMEPSIVVNSRSLNREWKLASMRSYKNVSKYDCCPNDTFSWVSFEFMLQRHPGGYTSTVVMPALVLMLLTLVTFWMDPTETDRLLLATVDVLSHILFLQHLGRLLPANGDQTPLIIIFYRDSMILAAMALFASALIPDLRKTSLNLPLWASGLSSWVVQYRFGQIFVLRALDQKSVGAVSEMPRGGDGADSPRPSWTLFTSLLDFLCFVVTVLSYFTLLLGYIP